MNTGAELKRKFRAVWPHLDERTRRIMAASEAVSLGYGGVSLVQRACGLSRKAIAKGIAEIQGGSRPLVGRVRRPGAGRRTRPTRGRLPPWISAIPLAIALRDKPQARCTRETPP